MAYLHLIGLATHAWRQSACPYYLFNCTDTTILVSNCTLKQFSSSRLPWMVKFSGVAFYCHDMTSFPHYSPFVRESTRQPHGGWVPRTISQYRGALMVSWLKHWHVVIHIVISWFHLSVYLCFWHVTIGWTHWSRMTPSCVTELGNHWFCS